MKVADPPGGRPGEVSRSSIISESYDSCERFDQIDWIAATPSWSSIVVGVILPVLAIVALALTIDVVLCLAFEQWMGHFWTTPLWLVTTMAFPLVLIGTVAVIKLFIKISTAGPGRTKSKKTLRLANDAEIVEPELEGPL
jgi:hypothetical protein